jgi:hypothetical protein
VGEGANWVAMNIGAKSMEDKEKELLAQFHQTISEQLNARLSESPKCFGLLIVVSTGYGYAIELMP